MTRAYPPLLCCIASTAVFTLTGCATNTSPASSQPSNPPLLYVVQNGSAPEILAYPLGASATGQPVNTLTLPSAVQGVAFIALDSAGNIYTTTSDDVSSGTNGDIREYAAGAADTATPIRVIPANSTTTIPQGGWFGGGLSGIAVDPAGNIYVAEESNGVAIFSSTANGSVAPARFIPIGAVSTLTQPSGLAVDSAGNLYVGNADNGCSILVFGPNANGDVAPIRTLSQASCDFAIDGSDNLYIMSALALSEFAPGASGNAAPIRTISLNSGYLMLGGMTVDSAGNAYIASVGHRDPYNSFEDFVSSVMEFSPSASGDATPSVAFSPSGWTPATPYVYPASMAVH